MSAHGLPQDELCPWCHRRFAKACSSTALAKHPHNMPRTEEQRQRAALQTLHQERRNARREPQQNIVQS
jgi:hypothetical protein